VRGGRESRLALGLALVSALLAGASLAGAEGTVQLQQRQRELASRSHTALLDLYALDSEIVQARGALARIHARVAALRAQQTDVRRELVVVKHNVRAAQRLLGDRLRTLYEEGEPDAVAVLLGASSLDDAVTRLNEVEQSAELGANAVDDAKRGKSRLARLEATLAAQVHAARALEERARTTLQVLARARAQRVVYLGSLARERRLTAHRIASLADRARQIVRRAQGVQAAAPAPAAPAAAEAGTITVTATGYSLAGHTSTGMPVGPGVVAVDPSVIPLGTRLTVPGYGEGVAADTGSAVQGYRIDLWFPTLADALAWGRRTITISLH
jgi:3D (Asp-Asp-Asp) domain-containing protein